MSYYYKYKFISPEEGLFANVREEFKSYFDTGAVDDIMFNIWTGWCLSKLGMGTYPIYPALLHIENYSARLPDDFHGVREAWATTMWEKSFQSPTSIYQQVTWDTRTDVSVRLDNPDVYCNFCTECELPDVIQAVYKTTNSVIAQFRMSHLLRPGNIDGGCPEDLWCENRGAVSTDSYDVKDNKFSVTFPTGVVHIKYYAIGVDKTENRLVPDNFRITDYIFKYLKEKTMENLLNQATDESFNQLKYKYDLYKSQADEALIIADIETKKGDTYKQQRMINRIQRRNNKYNIR